MLARAAQTCWKVVSCIFLTRSRVAVSPHTVYDQRTHIKIHSLANTCMLNPQLARYWKEGLLSSSFFFFCSPVLCVQHGPRTIPLLHGCLHKCECVKSHRSPHRLSPVCFLKGGELEALGGQLVVVSVRPTWYPDNSDSKHWLCPPAPSPAASEPFPRLRPDPHDQTSVTSPCNPC